MNTKISAAVASAALVLGASSANAGIIVPAGEWTLDFNGNVNAYASIYDADDASTNTVTGGLAGTQDSRNESKSPSIGTGLLPAWLGVTGTTRQNDLDVSFTISIQPNTSSNSYTGDGAGLGTAVGPAAGDTNSSVLARQAFLTFGDKSWGTIKLGKDLGVFGSDAILNDMTLLGVGSGGAISGSALNTTNGGIGTGYIYAAWKGQVAYTTPNMNGFQATVAITNPNQFGTQAQSIYQDMFGIEAKASYAFSNGKIWVGTAQYEVSHDLGAARDFDIDVYEVGANANFGNLGVTAYLYSGEGAGTTFLGAYGSDAAGNERDSDGGYIQATYVLPTGTKIGAAYGISNLDLATGEAASDLVEENKRWTVGAYHPLTKHLNLVAEYTALEAESHDNASNDSTKVSVGAILFF
jgi:predicted porin